MPSRKDIDKALKLYEEFRESPPRRGRVREFDWPTSLTILGNVLHIKYDTTRGRKTEKYEHTFSEGSRPLFCADPKTGLIYLMDGRYHVTDRGIVDIDAQGLEIDD